MKRFFFLLLSAFMMFSLSACTEKETDTMPDIQGNGSAEESLDNANGESGEKTAQDTREGEDDTFVMEQDGGSMEADQETSPRILIAYFTWAENTYVENPDNVDTDATTSASVLPPGNAAKMAGWIQEEVGGDLFSIVVKEPYSSDYDECLDRAADEKAENARPELLYHVENMSDYDIVFLGFPKMEYGFNCVLCA